MTMIRCDHTDAWTALGMHYEAAGEAFDLRDAFANDSSRFARFSQEAPHLFADLSKNLIDAAPKTCCWRWRAKCGLEAHRDAMFAGEAHQRARKIAP